MSNPQLRRHMGLTSAVMVTVGSVIGSGIFVKPLDISRNLPDEFWIYGCWGGLGLVCLFGAFAYAELGAMFPEAGGQYAFLREGWGKFIAFLYGWALLLVINTGTLAALAVVFATTLARLVPLSEAAHWVAALGMIASLALANHFGVKWGALLQNLSTFAKLAALAVIVIGGFFLIGVETPTRAAPTVPSYKEPSTFIQGVVIAFMAIFWAYEGWYQLPFNAAELKRPERTLPGGLIYGVIILVVTYLAVNAVYLHVVPQEEMRYLATDVDVPVTAVERIFGDSAGSWLTILICLSVYGAANPNLLSSPRAYYAMAQDRMVPQILTRVHPRYRTPTVAIWTQAVWATVLVIVLKTFKDITEYVVFASLIFYGLTVAAVYVLRRRDPDRPRPFRCLGYPWTPAIFIAVVLFVDINVLSDPENQRNALIGLAILAAGVPAYFVMRGHARSKS